MRKFLFGSFNKLDILLWTLSVSLILITFFIFDREGYLTLTALLIGVTSLIYCAKGNPIGQVLMIVFSTIYGYISFGFAYYGELLTYVGMTLPMSFMALVSWIKNPYNGSKSEVKTNRISKKEVVFMFLLTAVVTVVFYFVLKFFGTENLAVSTLSVSTSFAAAYLTFRRSPYFALAYAVNDIVLVVLWILASISDKSYISVAVCFAVFLVNDLYGFISWRKMQIKQEKTE